MKHLFSSENPSDWSSTARCLSELRQEHPWSELNRRASRTVAVTDRPFSVISPRVARFVIQSTAGKDEDRALLVPKPRI